MNHLNDLIAHVLIKHGAIPMEVVELPTSDLITLVAEREREARRRSLEQQILDRVRCIFINEPNYLGELEYAESLCIEYLKLDPVRGARLLRRVCYEQWQFDQWFVYEAFESVVKRLVSLGILAPDNDDEEEYDGRIPDYYPFNDLDPDLIS